MQKKHYKEYKSPVAGLLWSVMMAGFGQLYNGQYVFGFILLIGEYSANLLSGLNLAVHNSFHGHYFQAHEVVDYQWACFIPLYIVFRFGKHLTKQSLLIITRRRGNLPEKPI